MESFVWRLGYCTLGLLASAVEWGEQPNPNFDVGEGVPLGMFGPSLRCKSGQNLVSLGPGKAQAIYPGTSIPLSAGNTLSLSAAGKLWMSVGSPHLHNGSSL